MRDGFARHASGLLVPADQQRIREIWTHAEWKHLDRAVSMLAKKNVDLFFGCPEPYCRDQPIERLRNADGGLTLRCRHKDRIVLRGI